MFSIEARKKIAFGCVALAASLMASVSSYAQTPAVMDAMTSVHYIPVAEPQVVQAGSQAVVIALAGESSDGSAVTYSIATQPSHGTLSSVDTNTGQVTYTPVDLASTDSFTFEVYDGYHASMPATVSIEATGASSGSGGSSGGSGGGGAIGLWGLMALAIISVARNYQKCLVQANLRHG